MGLIKCSGMGVAIGVMFLLVISCGGSSGLVQNYNELNEVVESREFQIEHDWAFPQSGDRIDLIGNPNHVRFIGDSVAVFLPYFGVRHSGVSYGSREGGIRYEGPAENLQVSEISGKDRMEIRFSGEMNNENLEFRVILFSNGNAHTSVNSSQRGSISYQGKLRPIPEKIRSQIRR